MVSGAGGGGYVFGNGGFGGGMQAGNAKGKNYTSIGANQTFGHLKGIGENGQDKTYYGDNGAEGNGGAGGGYFGGTLVHYMGNFSNTPGSGGSSYISGHQGCQTHPKMKFYSTKVLSGEEFFSLPDGRVNKGNDGHGYFRINIVNECSILQSPF